MGNSPAKENVAMISAHFGTLQTAGFGNFHNRDLALEYQSNEAMISGLPEYAKAVVRAMTTNQNLNKNL